MVEFKEPRRAQIWYSIKGGEKTEIVEVAKAELENGKTIQVWLEGSQTPDYYANGINFLD